MESPVMGPDSGRPATYGSETVASNRHDSAKTVSNSHLMNGCARYCILTPCSAKKSVPRAIAAKDLKPGDQRSVEAQWAELVRSAGSRAAAGEVYIGSAFKVARRVADFLSADLFIVSAGLGLVPASAQIPSYGITFASGYAESLRSRVTGHFDPAAWWQSLKSGPYSVDVEDILNPAPSLVLVALSKDYSDAIEADLSQIEAQLPGRMRIFGMSIGRSLPRNLTPYAMPYDSRLETLTRRGTNKDFPQRALAHFVSHIPDLKARSEEHAAFVRNALSGVDPPVRLKNPSVSDDKVASHILEAIKVVGRKREQVLKYIRHEKGVACEERRFRGIFRNWREQQL